MIQLIRAGEGQECNSYHSVHGKSKLEKHIVLVSMR